MGSSPVAVTSPSDFAPASSKEFLDIQATTECGFTLKLVRDMTRTYRLPCVFIFKDSGTAVLGNQKVKYLPSSPTMTSLWVAIQPNWSSALSQIRNFDGPWPGYNMLNGSEPCFLHNKSNIIVLHVGDKLC